MSSKDTEQSASESSRQAELATNDGDQLGACIYLTPADLRALDIDPDHADAITYDVDADTEQLEITVAAETAGDQQ